MSKCKKKVIIVIGRSFGSGAREIGKKVAVELDIPFYDKELLEVEAKGSKYSIDDLDKYDEKKISAYVYTMAFNPYSADSLIPLDFLVESIQIKAIKTVADKGSCVIIGRRADKVLRGSYDVLSVFISAPMEQRIERVSKRDGLSEKDSKKAILKADKIRQTYYNDFGEGAWGDVSNYNLCINSGDLGIENSAALIIDCLRLKGKLDAS